MKYRSIALFLLIPLYFTGFAQRKAGKTVFILLDEQALYQCKQQYQNKDTAMVAEVNNLIARADSLLSAAPYSVTYHKTKLAPSNDKHDYVSQAPYWWPDSSKKDGKPYIRKDGRRNPEIHLLHDDSQMGSLCNSLPWPGTLQVTKNIHKKLKVYCKFGS
jgi:hypothetical protein